MTFKPWVAIAVGLVLVALVTFLVIQRLELKAANAELALLIANVATAKVDNDACIATVGTLQAANDTWAGSAAQGVAAAEEAAAQLAAAQAARATTETKLRLAEARDKALPKCVSLMNVDLAAVCPDTAAALKARSR